MGMDARCGGLAVAAGAAVRRPLQPRDTNVAPSSTVAFGKAAPPKHKTKPKAGPTLAKPPPPPPVEAAAAVPPVAEVSLAEELERARERRARMRAARDRAEREMEVRAAALDREAAEWERRAEEQRRLVAELMRLIGMPEVYTPVESLRSKEERKRREAAALSGSSSRGSTSAGTPLQVDAGAESCCGQESVGSAATAETAKTTEFSS